MISYPCCLIQQIDAWFESSRRENDWEVHSNRKEEASKKERAKGKKQGGRENIKK